jgi:hypothetical protein
MVEWVVPGFWSSVLGGWWDHQMRQEPGGELWGIRMKPDLDTESEAPRPPGGDFY